MSTSRIIYGNGYELTIEIGRAMLRFAQTGREIPVTILDRCLEAQIDGQRRVIHLTPDEAAVIHSARDALRRE